jgi:ATP-dependent helicase/nuclease subunit A
MTPRDDATASQIRAANPAASTWLSANAGSGKTRVLTDRVARLLLAGTPPQNILCLTFTKAAASEMQNRLFRRLGEWAMADEEELRGKLAELGVERTPGAGELARARTLFARAVETPGGLKIQTIHSFCASILRRFPLEAGVPPNFTEMDDRAAARVQAEVMEALGREAPEALRDLARHLGGDGPEDLLKAVVSGRTAFDPPLDRGAICAALNCDPSLSEEAILARCFTGDEPDLCTALIPHLRQGGVNDGKLADKMVALRPGETVEALHGWCRALLTGKMGIPKNGPPGKAVTQAAAELCEALAELRERLICALGELNLLATVERTAALHRFAGAYLSRYEAAKAARGLLDFDDLILKTRDLLTAPGLADWVLYRLDGGIDHVLVDEAQDTSPAQWEVIGLLADEITAGAGRAEAGARTLFVVGDQKQSIYSFQGADPQEFERMNQRFRDALEAGGGLMNLELVYSFRSAPPVLTAVDGALSGKAGLGGPVHHIPFHEAMPGRVDLWPVTRPEEAVADAPWYDPVDRVLPGDAKSLLAEALAGHIGEILSSGTRIAEPGGSARPVTPGDILILFRGRESGLFEAVIAACKGKGLPIAGADRMKLAAELAVRDITALLSFLATPEDDLSLAAALRSPLLGWSEDDLYRLAQPRGDAFLWAALRQRRDAPETLALLRDLLDQSDFLRPYELIERLLLRHGGRARLLGRLGHEAEDGIDMLLAQALAYETAEVPSLTGFLEWLTAEDIAVKRQADSAGGRIRVMTVHGAKGLEAPIVILPDTVHQPKGLRDALLQDAEGRAFWKPAADAVPEALADAVETAKAKAAAEEERLLYVAMTRAESWLIVAGAWGREKLPGTAWYPQIEAAMERLGAGPLATPLGDGRRLESPGWPAPTGAPAETPANTPAEAPPPGWCRLPLPPPPETPAPINPSQLGEAKALPGEGLDAEAAMQRGTDLHLLLEHLPGLPRAQRARAAEALLPLRPPEARAELLAEAEAVLDAPELAILFAPGTLAEVPVTAPLGWPGRGPLVGTIDRLVVGPDAVLIVDFKSNAVVPATPQDVPEGLLRQMGAYAEAMGQLYPGRRIDTAILWTRAARLQPLPAAQTRAALHRAVTA